MKYPKPEADSTTVHAILTHSLTKIYKDAFNRHPSVTALRDVSLEVRQGEIFGLLGPNGAGKTTFVKILLGFVRQSAGRAMLLGVPLPNVEVRTRIGYLPEAHRYPSYLTPVEVLMLFGGLSKMPRAAIASRISTLLPLVGLEQWKGMKVRRFSKGMLQRLGLAQALINDPPLLFLDEPTDGVDPVGRKEVRDLLVRLKHEGKTIFLNSHLLSEVEMISDRVAILDKGTILKVGTVEELTRRSNLYDIGVAGEVPEAFHHEAAANVLAFRMNGNVMTAEVKDVQELNRFVDTLRKHGVLITYLAQRKSSLEESFLALLKREMAP
ncbi:MAG: ABC transporter ATP-binding protein [Ignavibacteria bacterium]